MGVREKSSLGLEVSCQLPQRLELLSGLVRLRLEFGFQFGLEGGGGELEGLELCFEGGVVAWRGGGSGGRGK